MGEEKEKNECDEGGEEMVGQAQVVFVGELDYTSDDDNVQLGGPNPGMTIIDTLVRSWRVRG